MRLDRFLIPPDNEEIKYALIQAFSIIDDYEKKDILLVTPTKNPMHLEGISQILRAERFKRLKENETILLRGIPTRLESLQTFNESNPRNSVIIGIYSGKAMLGKIDDSNAMAAIAVPSHIDEDVKNWIKTWNPQIYGKEKTEEKKKLIDSCVVEKALEKITLLMSRPHTPQIMIRSTLDKEMTIALFKMLRKYNERYDPDSIRKWAVRNGWTSEGADELKDISQKVLEGKKIRGSKDPVLNEDIIKEWRDECNK